MDFHLRQSLQHLVEFFDVEAPSNSSGSSSSSPNPAGGISLDDRTLNPTNGGSGEVITEDLGPNAPGENESLQ